MKNFKTNVIKKVLPVFLLFVLLFNFVVPNYVYADDWKNRGGVLFSPIKWLILGIGDSVMHILQNIFVTTDTDIDMGGVYQIRYSPGIIFQGDVPGLDINFIDPMNPRIAEHDTKPKWKEKGFVVITSDSSSYVSPLLRDNQTKIDEIKGIMEDYISEETLNKFETMVKNGSIFASEYYKEWNAWYFKDTDGKNYRLNVGDRYYNDYRLYFDVDKNTNSGNSGGSGVQTPDWKEQFGCVVGDYYDSNLYASMNDVLPIGEMYIESIANDLKKHVSDERVQEFRQKIDNHQLFYDSWEPWEFIEGKKHCKLVGQEFGPYQQKMYVKVVFYTYIEQDTPSGGKVNESVAAQLKPTISKWYKGTRLIAMVGLLSVLLYVGIRIIISSTAADKAKYKKMLMDWLTALCMLFILHYIMVFVLTISKQITGIFSKMDTDFLMSNIRQQARDGNSVYVQFANTVMYLALVILTCVFTFQYLRRVLYMAFLTMIAPLICLTYPLDKVKDGQAQAFTMWIREYIFNALIQPVHLLIYMMLVGSASELVSVNPIYGIVAISFIVPAEKFIRKMFGFEKASTVGQLGAAAGGAMIMNMINKAKQAGGKGHSNSGSSSGASSSKGVRTPSNTTPLAALQNGSAADSNSGSTGNSGGQGEEGEQLSFLDQLGLDEASTESASNGVRTSIGGTSTEITARDKTFGTRLAGAAKSLNKRYKLTSPKQWAKRAAGLYGAVGLGTIGLAAGVATGDFGNAAKYAGAGALAGYAGAGGLVESATDLGSTVYEGYIGEEAYENKQFEKKFYKSNDYLKLQQKYSGDVKGYAQEFLNAGITDTTKMDIALASGLPAQDAIAYATIAKGCPGGTLHDLKKFKDYLQQQDINVENDNMVRDYYNKVKLFT